MEFFLDTPRPESRKQPYTINVSSKAGEKTLLLKTVFSKHPKQQYILVQQITLNSSSETYEYD